MAPKYQVSMIPFYSEKAFCTSGAHTYDTVCAWWVIRACFDRRAKPLFIHSYFIIHIFICGKKRSYYLPQITIKIIIVLLQDIIRKHNLIFNACSTTVATTQPKKRPRGFVILVSHVVEERPQEAEVITI